MQNLDLPLIENDWDNWIYLYKYDSLKYIYDIYYEFNNKSFFIYNVDYLS